nr:hypothetical protein [Tanacetum cinerariifolium]
MKSLSKKKEKIIVEKRKGIDFLSKVALTKEARYEKVRKKSLREFHKTYLSGSGTVTKTAPSAAKIKHSVTDEGTGVKPGVPSVTEKESTKKKKEEIEDDEEEEEDEFVKTPSNDTSDEDETKCKDKDEGDEDEGMDYTTNQFDDDVDLRMNEQVTTDEGLIQKEEFELKKIFIDKMNESQSYLDKSLFFTYDKVYSLKRSRKDKDKDKDPSTGSDRGLKKKKISKDVGPTKGLKAKESQFGSSKGTKSKSKSSGKSVQSEESEFEIADSDMPQDQEEKPGNDDEERKGKGASKHFSTYIMNGLKITNLTQETLLGLASRLLKGTRSNYAELEYNFKECYNALSENLDWNNPKGGNYTFSLTKPLPLVMNGNHQMVSIDYFFNNDLKYLQGGILRMTYMTSLMKTKAAQYDLPSIKDIAQNIWSHVKVAYDKHALWGIPHWRDQRKTFYRYARSLESTHDVYSTKHILAVTQNRITNLSGDDVSDFAIALQMFTRNMVIQRRVEDL